MTAPRPRADDIQKTCGAATRCISPQDSQFLFGYPHVERYSTGVNDDLYVSALYINDGTTAVLFCSNDLIGLGKHHCSLIRSAIAERTGIAFEHIQVGCTHTHSAPNSLEYASNANDSVVPKPDSRYLDFVTQQNIAAAIEAVDTARPAEIGTTTQTVHGLGTNRRHPDGPHDPRVTVTSARDGAGGLIALMLTYAMHPTVLHEDSTVVSADFPGYARQGLQAATGSRDLPVLFNLGTAGNQSPRYMVAQNTVSEAKRLGDILAASVITALDRTDYHDPDLSVTTEYLELPIRRFPEPEAAQRDLTEVHARLAELRAAQADRAAVRTAETDWFGAEETFCLAKLQATGRLAAFIAGCLPAELACVRLNDWWYCVWPGEFFVEYGLQIAADFPRSTVVTMGNGDLQGYIVTEQAVRQRAYEAANALFDWTAGTAVVEATRRMLRELTVR